jgi:hypothetical protein
VRQQCRNPLRRYARQYFGVEREGRHAIVIDLLAIAPDSLSFREPSRGIIVQQIPMEHPCTRLWAHYDVENDRATAATFPSDARGP